MTPKGASSEADVGRFRPEFWEWFEGRILRALDRRDRALAARITNGTRARVEHDAAAAVEPVRPGRAPGGAAAAGR